MGTTTHLEDALQTARYREVKQAATEADARSERALAAAAAALGAWRAEPTSKELEVAYGKATAEADAAFVDWQAKFHAWDLLQDEMFTESDDELY